MEENKKCNHCTRVKQITDFLVDYDQKEKKKYRMDVCRECYDDVFVLEKGEKRQAMMRQKVVTHLGGKCAWCDFYDPRALCIDHIFGEGNLERKSGKNWYSLYREILSGDRDWEFQVLCANCNSIKRHKYDR